MLVNILMYIYDMIFVYILSSIIYLYIPRRYWDVLRGKQHLSTQDTLEADTTWSTENCILGFGVMGIWPKSADGTDINAVDVLKSKQLVNIYKTIFT
jgi:hypothetical protein